MAEPIAAEIGNIILLNKGENKGTKGKVIAVYTNSVAVQLERKQKDGTLARTVVNHKNYEIISN